MAKKVRRAAKSKGEDTDLRRWCIEQALKWPWNPGRPGGYGAMGGQLPIPAEPPSWPNVIERANTILQWVKLT